MSSTWRKPVPISFQPEEYFKIEGTCMEMCPHEEIKLRERERLLHKFEILEEQKFHQTEPSSLSSWPVAEGYNYNDASLRSGPGSGPGQSQSLNNRGHARGRGRNGQGLGLARGGGKPSPKADPQKTIKSFARSAAGQNKTKPKDLRPASVLKNTVKYLCNQILPKADCPYNVVYDFIFDRLRAVRQDLVIQRIETEDAIIILETIVKFHIYSDFRLRNEQISIYDPHINQKHLVDCLRKLLSLYKVNDYWQESRCEFESLNCLIFLESYDVISRAISIKARLNSSQFNSAIDMALAYQSRNYVRFFRSYSTLSLILQMYCIRYVGGMRSTAFQVMCSAFGVNTCKIPLGVIASLLLYRDINAVHEDLSKLKTSVEIIRSEGDGSEKSEKFAKFKKANGGVALIESKTGDLSSDFRPSPTHVMTKGFSVPAISVLVCRI